MMAHTSPARLRRAAVLVMYSVGFSLPDRIRPGHTLTPGDNASLHLTYHPTYSMDNINNIYIFVIITTLEPGSIKLSQTSRSVEVDAHLYVSIMKLR